MGGTAIPTPLKPATQDEQNSAGCGWMPRSGARGGWLRLLTHRKALATAINDHPCYKGHRQQSHTTEYS